MKRLMLILGALVLALGLSTTPAQAGQPLGSVPDWEITKVAMEAQGWVYTPAEEVPLNKIRKVGPVSAKRTVVYGCNNNTVCLYQWINYGGDRWSSTFGNWLNWPGQCINLSPAVWDNGTPVSDNQGSMITNGTGSYSPLTYFEFNNYYQCAGGGVTSYPADRVTGVVNWANIPIGPGMNAYHNITSIRRGN